RRGGARRSVVRRGRGRRRLVWTARRRRLVRRRLVRRGVVRRGLVRSLGVKARPNDDPGKAPRPVAFPGRVVACTAILGLAVVGLGFLGASRGTPIGVPWTSMAPFLALLTAAEYLLVRVHYRDQVLAITLFEAALAPLMFSSPTLAVIAVVV